MPVCTKIDWAQEPQIAPCAIGEPVDYTGMQILATYDDNTQETIDVTPRMLNESSLQTTASIRKSMIVYQGQRLPVLVPVLNISLDHIEVKAEESLWGREGEPFERSQVSVTAFYSDGSSKPIEHYKVAPGRGLEKDTTEITIRYGRSTDVLPIRVFAIGEEIPSVERMELQQEPQQKSLQLEPVTATDEAPAETPQKEPQRPIPEPLPQDLTTDIPEPQSASEATVASSAGTNKAKVLQVVSIAQLPMKLQYNVGETEADLSGGRLNLIYMDGTIEQVDMKADGAINVACNISGRGCVAFTYEGKPVTYPIEVLTPAVAIGLQLTKMPEKLVYEQGSMEVDMAGAELTVHLSNGTDKTVDVTTDMIGPFNFTETGKSNIFIMYQGFSVLCPVIVVPKTAMSQYTTTRYSPTVFPGTETLPTPEPEPPKERTGEEVRETPGDAAREVQEPANAATEHTEMRLMEEKAGTTPEADEKAAAEEPSVDGGELTEELPGDSAGPASPPESTKEVPDFYVSTFGLRFDIDMPQ